MGNTFFAFHSFALFRSCYNSQLIELKLNSQSRILVNSGPFSRTASFFLPDFKSLSVFKITIGWVLETKIALTHFFFSGTVRFGLVLFLKFFLALVAFHEQ